MTDKELLDKAICWFKMIADDMEHITSANVSHQSCTTKGRAIRAYEFIEKHRNSLPEEPSLVFVVTRSEEHSDYVEAAFANKEKAEEYCKPFNDDEDSYHRDIAEIKITY